MVGRLGEVPLPTTIATLIVGGGGGGGGSYKKSFFKSAENFGDC